MKTVIDNSISNGFGYTIKATRCQDGSTVASYLYATPNTSEVQTRPRPCRTEREAVFSALECLYRDVQARIFQLGHNDERCRWEIPFLRRMTARILKDCEKYDPKQLGLWAD